VSQKKIIVIGGAAAGPKAAARARRIDAQAKITIFQKAKDLSMASCGYPYYVGGVFDDRNMLICTPSGVIRDKDFFQKAKDIDVQIETEVVAIDRKNQRIKAKDLKTGSEFEQEYNKLIICTGAKPKLPPIPGIDLTGITTLLSLADADYLRKITDEGLIKKAVIVGGGLIGIETCEALHLADIEVTIVEAMPQLLTFLDWQPAKIVENHIRSKGVNIITNNGLSEFLGENGKLTAVKLQNGTELPCQLAVIAVGVKPDAKLAADAGLTTGKWGGICVNEYMQTSDPNIYAAGDCVEIPNLLTNQMMHMPMGDLANLQGRVAGENAASENCATFPGTIQTSICKIYDFSAGSSGLSETAARKSGFTDIETIINASPDKPGFMGGKLLISKLIINKTTRKILGYQSVGSGDVSRQITSAALTISAGLTIDQLINLDLPYAPPFSLAIDHFIASAHIMQNKLAGLMNGISAKEVYDRLSNKKLFFLDVRGADEYEIMRLGIGEVLIPLGSLRQRLHELPADKSREIVCFCKISLRGYEAALILKTHGWTNVKVLEGGILAWPFPREK
jgi:NADPH-dependent 2,4-dienoyl-CoA reductase/sulfur reductase-like enzyme/rhodanese-related sulfurtransferase